MRKAAWLWVFLGAVSCGAPKYVPYVGVHKDFRCRVPWGWSVVTDQEGDHYENTDFLGSFDGRFYLGIPSLSVRWYSYYFPHTLRDGSIEIYSSAQDYVRQMLHDVYGPRPIFIKSPRDIVLSGGLKARYFVVLSPVQVPAKTPWGASLDSRTGKTVNLREHAYVLAPLQEGFFVMIYPATHAGYESHKTDFNVLVNTFVPLKEGPSGPAVSAARTAF